MLEQPQFRTRVKICGLTTLQDARFASGAQADFLGFIFYPKSKRYIKPNKAGAIVHWVEGPSCVGVFVDQPGDEVNEIARSTGVEYVQLHGDESREYCMKMEKPVIKTIRINEEVTSEELAEKVNYYHDVVHYLMFDTKVDHLEGGTGETFDWNIISNVAGDIPFFLAGGLNAENIRKAMDEVKPFAIDVASGVEMEPGVKDYEKMEALFDEIYSVWEEQDESF